MVDATIAVMLLALFMGLIGLSLGLERQTIRLLTAVLTLLTLAIVAYIVVALV